jgi:hypothetical protein
MSSSTPKSTKEDYMKSENESDNYQRLVYFDSHSPVRGGVLLVHSTFETQGSTIVQSAVATIFRDGGQLMAHIPSNVLVHRASVHEAQADSDDKYEIFSHSDDE